MTSAQRGRAVTRRHRLRRTAAILAGVALLGLLLLWWIYRASRPEVRRPGELPPEITENLSRDLPADAPEPRFRDVTDDAGLGDFVAFVGPRTSQLPEDMGSGLAWGDVDGDGDDDLFLVGAGGALDEPATWARSRLYENRAAQGVEPGEALFRPVEGFPELRIVGMGAAWGDYDGDGGLDLAVSGYRALHLLRRGEDGWTPQSALDDALAEAGVSPSDGYWSGVAWADFDADGDLDLYVCGYVKYVEDSSDERSVSQQFVSRQYGAAVPYTLNPASFEPERNLLFENAGDGTFEEVALLYGVANPEGRSLSALWHDFDADGRLDLYVANDISDNALYLNRGETFEDAGLEAWVADYRGAMGLAAGDWNRDGDDDLFVTHWIAQENALYDNRLADAAGPSRLTFTDLAGRVGLGQIALHKVGWGTEFLDVDSDGRLDLVVANGSTLETGDDPKGLEAQAMMLLWNDGDHFHDLAPGAPGLAEKRVHRGLATADYDLDGDVDVAVTHLDGGVRLLRNDVPGGHWLELRLRGGTGRGEGAQVTVHAEGLPPLRRSVTGASYLSQSSSMLHFGLGDAPLGDAPVERVEVRWLGGDVQTFEGLGADARWELTEGDPVPRRLTPRREAALEPQQVRQFWELQRAAMDAMKRDGDTERAIGLFRRALELDPRHGDSRYYLANCLWSAGQPEAALAELDRLRRHDPGSHRAHKQWGVLRAITAETGEQLDAAEEALERASEINSEETGVLLVLGEIALLEGDDELADQRFEWVIRTHPKAVGAYFLRGYLAWKRGDEEAAVAFLEDARAARGEAWKPEGTAAEGDVARLMHREESPLSHHWQAWDGTPDPEEAFASLAGSGGE